MRSIPDPDSVWPDEAALARKHLSCMPRERRARLERKWLADEAAVLTSNEPLNARRYLAERGFKTEDEDDD